MQTPLRACYAGSGPLLFSLLLLAGCATHPSQCDPSRESFAGALGGVVSGCYQARQTHLETRLGQEQAMNQAFRDLLAAIEAEKAQVRGELSHRETRYAELNRSWRALQVTLDTKSRRNAALAQQVQRMENNLAALNAGDDMAYREKQRVLEDLRRQTRILQQELEAGLY